MDGLWNQGWFLLQTAWHRARYEVDGHIILVVAVVAVFLLLWIFLSPEVTRKGS